MNDVIPKVGHQGKKERRNASLLWRELMVKKDAGVYSTVKRNVQNRFGQHGITPDFITEKVSHRFTEQGPVTRYGVSAICFLDSTSFLAQQLAKIQQEMSALSALKGKVLLAPSNNFHLSICFFSDGEQKPVSQEVIDAHTVKFKRLMNGVQSFDVAFKGLLMSSLHGRIWARGYATPFRKKDGSIDDHFSAFQEKAARETMHYEGIRSYWHEITGLSIASVVKPLSLTEFSELSSFLASKDNLDLSSMPIKEIQLVHHADDHLSQFEVVETINLR